MEQKNQIYQLIEDATTIAASHFGLAVWGIELAGGSGRPVARIFVDTPWQDLPSGALTEKIDVTPDAGKKHGEAQDADFFDYEEELPQGVTVEQCASISRMVGVSLDVEDLFTTAWILEVSSPGMERTFFQPDQLVPYVGSTVEVTLLDSHPDFVNRRKFRGILKSAQGQEFSLELETPAGTGCSLKWDDVRKARLVHIFPDTTLPKAKAAKEEVKKS